MKTEDRAEDQAAAQFASICAMLAAVECDYDRLEELRDTEPEDLSDEDREELAELEELVGDCESEESARERIQEDPLSVEVRSDWASPGEPLEAAEFCILLCTGGPAVRIRGELDRGEPRRAWLEYQDWGIPWVQYFGASNDILCQYALHFFFGE